MTKHYFMSVAICCKLQQGRHTQDCRVFGSGFKNIFSILYHFLIRAQNRLVIQISLKISIRGHFQNRACLLCFLVGAVIITIRVFMRVVLVPPNIQRALIQDINKQRYN